MRFRRRRVARARHPLRFQAAKQAFHRGIISTVSAPTHALLNPVTPQPLPELPAGVLPTLVGMEHQPRWSPALLKGHIQCLHHQVGIGPRRECPTDDPACEQIQYRRQIMPTSLRPQIGDVATPDLVLRRHIELPIKVIRDINSFDRCSLICMTAWLLTDQPELFHQATDFEATNRSTLLAQHPHNAAAACRTAALHKQLVHTTTQGHALAPLAVGVIARSRYVKQRA
jgi:hypothetical protein